MTTKHDFDAFLDTQDLQNPPYHEQIAVMHEWELEREAALMQRGAIDALQNLSVIRKSRPLRERTSSSHTFLTKRRNQSVNVEGVGWSKCRARTLHKTTVRH